MRDATKASYEIENRKGIKFLLGLKKNLLGGFTAIAYQKGAYAWLDLGGKKVLMLNDAQGIEHVFKTNAKNYVKSKFYKVLRPMLGKSILLSEGELWKKQRKESSPVFTPKALDEMAPQMIDAINAMFKRWEPHIAQGQALDLNFETMLFTLDVLFRTLFHEVKEGIAADMQTAIIALLREAEERVWAIIKLPQWATFLLPKYRKSLRFLNRTIQELQTARRQNKAYPEDLLSRLIANYGTSTEEKKLLRDQMMTFLLAGHETTANGLVWSCYYLSMRPEIWQKMQAEVDHVLQGAAPKLADLKNLTYCRQVFDEVIRFHPVVWTMSRDALTDDIIPLDDGSAINLPRGTTVMLCSYIVHRREKYWENPEAFDPDRFAPDISRKRPTFAYFAFGGGPRQCLGMRFAIIESVFTLAMLAQNYKLHLVPGQDTYALPNITLRPNGPIYFKIVPRKGHLEEAPERSSIIHTPMASAEPSACPFNHSLEAAS